MGPRNCFWACTSVRRRGRGRDRGGVENGDCHRQAGRAAGSRRAAGGQVASCLEQQDRLFQAEPSVGTHIDADLATGEHLLELPPEDLADGEPRVIRLTASTRLAHDDEDDDAAAAGARRPPRQPFLRNAFNTFL